MDMMLVMNQTTAQEIATQAHAGIEDLHGFPYLDHVKQVVRGVFEEDKAVAWLHDVVEDTDIKLEDLVAKGLTATEARALELVTRDKTLDQTYMDWIKVLAGEDGAAGAMARRVKLSDLRHNQARPKHQSQKGINKRYERAEQIIVDAMNERGEEIPPNVQL